MSSHKDAAYFAVRDIPEWRRLVNSDVDELCGKRAAQAYQASCRPNLKEIDQVCEDVCLYLARKIGHVLLHKKEKKSRGFCNVAKRSLATLSAIK